MDSINADTEKTNILNNTYYEYPVPIPAMAALVDHRLVHGKIVGRITKPSKTNEGKITILYLIMPSSGEPTFEPILVNAKDILPE